jgi:AAA domain
VIGMSSNPWISRFDHLATREQLKKALDRRAEPIKSPSQLRAEVLCGQFRLKSRESFFPTEQSLDVAERIVGVAQAYAHQVYPNQKSFLERIYGDNILCDANPIALTGYAGIGKSSLLRRLAEAIGGAESIKIDSFHPPFPISPPYMMAIQERVSLKQIMQSLAGANSGSHEKLLRRTQKVAYQTAIPLILVDEFQFLAISQSANVLIAKLLLGLSYIGLPFVYAANFSLMQKLIKRPEEEKQRILGDVILMEPDHYSSDCWKNTIARVTDIAPEIFQLDIESSAKKLFEMTVGRKRALVELLIESIRVAVENNTVVTQSVIDHAFKSSRYSMYRGDVEVIAKQNVIGKPTKGRLDLWCPEQIKPFVSHPSIKEATENRAQQVAQQELRSAMSPRERKLIKDIETISGGQLKKTRATVIKMPATDKNTSLIESTMNFLDEIS